MKKTSAIVVMISILALAGCASDNSENAQLKSAPQVTTPNGSSPAKANAPHASMNDTDEMRSGWNHGNGTLWVYLQPGGYSWSDGSVDKDGSLRLKFGWWRGIRGKFTVEGHRLDAPAAPLRYEIHADSYGDMGFMPSYLFFPTEGYWQITGHIGEKSLTFVIHVSKTNT